MLYNITKLIGVKKRGFKMASDIKIYLVKGKMMVAHDKFPMWTKFEIYVRGLKKEHAIERIYSELGSRHKMKREHIKIESIEEVPIESVTDPSMLKLFELNKVVKY
ncbi:MAG: 50S ribosomal protein L18Ae [Caldisphaera sp.]|jgi:large subunit ribosomal protein LX|uniref:50S ribosomal protein L18Ae n=1 Tax=Caldisphaera sp. TaxID=2060322 RepID=UPI00397A7D4B